MSYERPAITELGSVADFTRADWFASGHDGAVWFLEPIKGDKGGGGHTS